MGRYAYSLTVKVIPAALDKHWTFLTSMYSLQVFLHWLVINILQICYEKTGCAICLIYGMNLQPAL